MIRITTFFFLFLLSIAVHAHPWKPDHYIIIDTDGGFDDFRTINLLLASPDVRVLAITASDGVIEAEQVYIKVRSLLYQLHHEGILVGLHNDSGSIAMNCKPAMDFSWGVPTEDSIPMHSAAELVNYICRNTREQITFICLGSLSTAASCLIEVNQLADRLKQIIWTNDFQLTDDNFNYSINPLAYNRVTENFTIPLKRISGDAGNSVYSKQFIGSIDSVHSPYAKNIIRSLREEEVPYATRWYDESASLFLHFPDFFTVDSGSLDDFYELKVEDKTELNRSFLDILNGNSSNQNQVLSFFPMDTSLYQNDVQAIMTDALYNCGKEEWIAGVIANELHRHLGIYATIGVKMGIRAREYFGAGVDEMEILSYAGQIPPYSCMNDGLQVSTGATLGHGLIHVETGINNTPGAEFTYLGQRIAITLRDEYRNKIESQIRELSNIYGINNDIYWAMVRNSALYYWANWDRNSIFDIQVIQSDREQ